MKKARLIILTILILGGGLAALLSLKSPASRTSSQDLNLETSPSGLESSEKEPKPKEGGNSAEDIKNETAAAQKSAESLQPEEQREAVFSKFEFKEQINQYGQLAKKVLRPESDADWMKKVQHDEHLVSSLGNLLTTPAITSQEMVLQDLAIDLLLDSVKDQPSGPAAKVLNEIVSHGAVENKEIPQKQRENLAGIKGEVMMKWISSVPDEEGQMAGRLPGPVSKKVWQNVLAMKENNQKESQQMTK